MQYLWRRFGLQGVAVIWVVLFAWGLFAVTRYRQREAIRQKRVAAVTAIGDKLGRAFRAYFDAHKLCPSAENWEQELRPYAHDPDFSVVIPASYGVPQHRFAMYRPLSGLPYKKLGQPEWDILTFYESTLPGPNAADDLASLPPEDGTHGFVTVEFDGASKYALAKGSKSVYVPVGPRYYAFYQEPSARQSVIEQFRNSVAR